MLMGFYKVSEHKTHTCKINLLWRESSVGRPGIWSQNVSTRGLAEASCPCFNLSSLFFCRLGLKCCLSCVLDLQFWGMWVSFRGRPRSHQSGHLKCCCTVITKSTWILALDAQWSVRQLKVKGQSIAVWLLQTQIHFSPMHNNQQLG